MHVSENSSENVTQQPYFACVADGVFWEDREGVKVLSCVNRAIMRLQEHHEETTIKQEIGTYLMSTQVKSVIEISV